MRRINPSDSRRREELAKGEGSNLQRCLYRRGEDQSHGKDQALFWSFFLCRFSDFKLCLYRAMAV